MYRSCDRVPAKLPWKLECRCGLALLFRVCVGYQGIVDLVKIMLIVFLFFHLWMLRSHSCGCSRQVVYFPLKLLLLLTTRSYLKEINFIIVILYLFALLNIPADELRGFHSKYQKASSTKWNPSIIMSFLIPLPLTKLM